ncbi:MAG TPA: DUF4097 family beta strand repeat-containing protein [Gemmatales bacterium]|nr:DUF4097 family beta strand repeat-containing protein [Gemmatales bacterium]HMP58378.1 DUF4097 family beta strand repeat-containing protein [Gemmatales bacterium]
MHHALRLPLLAALLLPLGSSGCYFGFAQVHAEEVIEETFEVAGEPTVDVDSFNGSIKVEPGESGRVMVRVIKKVGAETEEVAVGRLGDIEVAMGETEPDHIRVTAKLRSKGLVSGSYGARVELVVPAKATLQLRTSNGNVTVTDVNGSVTARSTNGSLKVQGNAVMNLNSSNGNIEVIGDQITVTADTTNGSIMLKGSLAQAVHSLTTSNGSIRLQLPGDSQFHLDAATSNSRVECSFQVETKTAGKRDRTLTGTVGSDPKTSLKLRTSNGNIRILKE